jgi:hypothetical protein
LDDDGIERVIAEIHGYDPLLAQRLTMMVKKYQYRPIVALLDIANEEVP